MPETERASFVKVHGWIPVIKLIAFAALVVFIAATGLYLVADVYQNGSPFSIEAPPLTNATYAFSLNVPNATYSGGEVIGANPDLRVGIFLRFDTAVVAGADIGIGAKVVVSPTADPRVRDASVIAIAIPDSRVSSSFNDMSFGIPNEF